VAAHFALGKPACVARAEINETVDAEMSPASIRDAGLRIEPVERRREFDEAGVCEKSVDDYEVLAAEGHESFHDEATATHWTFNGSEFWSFDDPESVGWKADYLTVRGLRGAMFRELSGGTPDASLLNALRGSLPRVPAN
jgi:GH18 family chitinase